jgi:hypothetical protein
LFQKFAAATGDQQTELQTHNFKPMERLMQEQKQPNSEQGSQQSAAAGSEYERYAQRPDAIILPGGVIEVPVEEGE